MFFRTALEDASPGSQLQELARAALDRLASVEK
jgi:hypothetical protein